MTQEYRIKEIIALLSQHDYIIKVYQTAQDGCVIRYPVAKLLNPEHDKPFTLGYSIRRGEEPGVFYNSTREPEERFVGVPEYAQRMYVFAEMAAVARRLPISDVLIQYNNKEGHEVEGIEDILPDPTTKEQYEKEGILINLLKNGLRDESPERYAVLADQHGVSEGFKLVSAFYLGDSE